MLGLPRYLFGERHGSSFQPDTAPSIHARYAKGNGVTLYCGDRLELLQQIADAGDLAELIVTSPPYNTGKEYEERTTLDEYIEGQRQTIAACLKTLSPTGSICW